MTPLFLFAPVLDHEAIAGGTERIEQDSGRLGEGARGDGVPERERGKLSEQAPRLAGRTGGIKPPKSP